MDNDKVSEYLHRLVPDDIVGASYLYYRYLLQKGTFEGPEQLEKWAEIMAKRLHYKTADGQHYQEAE